MLRGEAAAEGSRAGDSLRVVQDRATAGEGLRVAAEAAALAADTARSKAETALVGALADAGALQAKVAQVRLPHCWIQQQDTGHRRWTVTCCVAEGFVVNSCMQVGADLGPQDRAHGLVQQGVRDHYLACTSAGSWAAI